MAGHSDWRLPNAKELQSIVDYTRAPAVTQSPAISPLFQVTQLGDGEYPFFWTSTTHLDGPPDLRGRAAVYVAFGRATGWSLKYAPIHSGRAASDAESAPVTSAPLFRQRSDLGKPAAAPVSVAASAPDRR